MALWNDKINRTILLSSILLFLSVALIIFFAVYPYEDPEKVPNALAWLFHPASLYIFVSLAFWAVYFNLLLLIGSIREKMNAFPGWTELAISAIITLTVSIFVGNLSNFPVKWIIFGTTALGTILITLWFMMSSTPREGASAS